MRIEIPMALPSVANLREHWSARARRTKAQRAAVTLALGSRRLELRLTAAVGRHPTMVTLTRLAPRKLDDDNLASAFKAVRDQVAAELGIDDGSERVAWVYKQAKSKSVAVTIEIQECPQSNGNKPPARKDTQPHGADGSK